MEPHYWWAIIGFGLIIVELVAGTFYLLVIGGAALIGAVLAWSGLPFAVQAVVTSVLAIAGVVYVHHRRASAAPPADSNALDVGQNVTMDAWVDEAQRLARVKYRNAQWDARVLGAGPVAPGAMLVISAIDGSTLHVTPRA
jgi:membrane protein implicated in regulation of membrane protease activity